MGKRGPAPKATAGWTKRIVRITAEHRQHVVALSVDLGYSLDTVIRLALWAYAYDRGVRWGGGVRLRAGSPWKTQRRPITEDKDRLRVWLSVPDQWLEAHDDGRLGVGSFAELVRAALDYVAEWDAAEWRWTAEDASRPAA